MLECSMRIKKNVWLAFYLLLCAGVLLLGVLSFLKYKDLKNTYTSEYEHLTQIISQTSHSILLQEEMMLEIMGLQLLKMSVIVTRKKVKDSLTRF
jgi:hypothetical protein